MAEPDQGLHPKWWTLIAACVATFMLLLDITIVNVALPDIQRELKASFSELQWVVDAYALGLASLLLTAGSLADLLGRRRVFVWGLALFSLASLLCGVAPDAVSLDIFRGLQGIGGAVLFATSLALIAQAFQGAERGTAFGIWGATIGGAVAIGPLVGGALTEGLGWEWIFFVNVPIGAAAIFLTLVRVGETRDPDATGIDWPGLVTFSGGLFLLVFALIRGNDQGWGDARTVAELAGSVVLLVAFLVVELRSSRPMLDLSLFRKPTFAAVSVVAFTLSASMFSMFLYLTLYIQNILGYSPLEAGWRFLPLSVISFFVAPLSGRFASRVPVQLYFAAGLAMVGLGLLLMGGVSDTSDWTALLDGFLVAGAGIGILNPAIASTAVGVVPPARSGMASGINNTFRQVGIATGIAAWGAIFQAHIHDKLHSVLAGTPGASHIQELTHGITSGQVAAVAHRAPPQFRHQLEVVGRHAFITGFNQILVYSAIVAFVGAAVGLVAVRRRDFVQMGEAAAAAHGA